MYFRTDLALEAFNRIKNVEGAKKKERISDNVKITDIKIDDEMAKKLKRPAGEYITVEFPFIGGLADSKAPEMEITKALKSMCPEKSGAVLVAGLGNDEITPDSIGPDTASRILATRHITKDFAESIGLKGLKSVAVIIPSVLGKTGIETVEIIKGITDRIHPCAVIVIDALAAGSIDRLFSTVQLCDSGISPGSGVKNARAEISKKTLGVPVIAIGVPTVVDVGTLANELTGEKVRTESDMIVTPKDVDILCEKTSEMLARAINTFLQPDIERDVILSLTN